MNSCAFANVRRNMAKKLNAVQIASALLWRQKFNLSYRDIARKTNMSKSSAHRVCCSQSRLLGGETTKTRTEKSNRGRKEKLGEREKRMLLRTLLRLRRENVNMTAETIMEAAGLTGYASRRTVSRYLNKSGYRFLQARKKGLLDEGDKQKRLKYARKMAAVLKRNPDFYKEHVSF